MRDGVVFIAEVVTLQTAAGGVKESGNFAVQTVDAFEQLLFVRLLVFLLIFCSGS